MSYLDQRLALKNKKKLISIMHDTIHEDNSNYFKNINNFKNLKKMILEKSDAVISVSNETKKNIVRLYNINEKKFMLYTLIIKQIRILKNLTYQKIIFFMWEIEVNIKILIF